MKSDLYSSADIVVLPTKAKFFGLVIAAALSHGISVVTTRNAPRSGLSDHRCGRWLDLETEALDRTLVEATALQRSALRDMGERGWSWMESDFGWQSVDEKIMSNYESVASGSAPPDARRLD
ncbi:hypothetical protein [Silicimonas algicola]|uniref:hypothetical protein n=1 Tax=Silicimonas algicola TaxID=1826607 RepID=UPI0013DE8D30|nr:hypothetical protein [Silicimonas algicola]